MTFTHHEHTPSPEHPFAEFIRIIGKGKKGSRPLTQAEAYQAMKMIQWLYCIYVLPHHAIENPS